MVKKPTIKKVAMATKAYVQTLIDLKQKIQAAQIKAVFAVNQELLLLYWLIGKTITERQTLDGWGTSQVERLAQDLQNAFPGMAGFSRSNIFRIKAFYAAYELVAQAARQLEDLPIFHIPWFHNVTLLQKIKSADERLWYAQKTVEHNWSRAALEHWIKSELYRREGRAVTNFKLTLPESHSSLAQQALKDPYVFDFLTLQADHLERDLEDGLIANVQKLLLEMGKGFALIGRQYHLVVDGDDYYIDLLFYHVTLKCYIVVELKARDFTPSDVGQLNFYLSAVDDRLCQPGDRPTIGLLLCKTKKNFTAEYALRGVAAPIGVAEYQVEIMQKLPKELKSKLPTIAELEAELEKTAALMAAAVRPKVRKKS